MNISRYVKHYNLLFSPDLLQRIATHTQKCCTDKDFPVISGLSVKDEAQRAFRIARAAKQDWNLADAAVGQKNYVSTILNKVLGYDLRYECPESGIPANDYNKELLFSVELQGTPDPEVTLYPVSFLLSGGSGRPILPVIVVPAAYSLDDKYTFSTGQRMSATQMMQAFLNASEPYMWALVTNGSNWRLLRDNPALSRPCYLDVDLDLILQDGESQVFDSMFWRMFHVSRAEWHGSEGAASCLWEQWRQELEEHGARVRSGLRVGVEQAICALGTGFLRGNGPGNTRLRVMLASGELSTQDFYQQLMRTAYRLIFLSVMEERKLLHAHDKLNHHAADTYRKGFSLARLTSRAMRIGEESRYDDLWQAQRIVFAALGRDGGSPQLALPALGGLFDSHQCPALDACRLPNSAFLSAIHFLRWATTDNKRTLIDYANMGAEELGSVYESLLELTPCISAEGQFFYFFGDAMDPTASASKQKGNSRKKTGSYYTPSCLVEQVLKTSLDPLLDECCKNPVFAKNRILDLRIIDPSCGSGHFLLAAARRVAERLATMRTQGQQGYTTEVYQRAMHDVIRNCIYGVDINPMAIELVRMNLWLEGYQPGKALSFLDDHLRCGNSLLGLFSEDTLSLPIPKDAYAATEGDDKEVCKILRATNSRSIKDRSKSAGLLWNWKQERIEESIYADDAPSQVKRQAQAWAAHRQKRFASQQAIAADIWMGAFLVSKTQQECVPTTDTLDQFLAGMYSADFLPIRTARQVCRESQVFHWFLEFPEVFARGGFDCVIGNPPWEKMKIQEKEWFAVSCPQIAECSKTAERHKLIDQLKCGELPGMTPDSQRALYTRYQKALHAAAVTSCFVHVAKDEGGRFPLTGVGDVNMFALFGETAYNLRTEQGGYVGLIIPTSIATDASTSAFFNELVKKQLLQTVFDFENKELFPDVHKSYKFAVLGIASSPTIDIACYMTHPRQIEDEERHARMQIEDFARINPNTGTCPLFRSKKDAELTVKIYRNVPILRNEQTGDNPWGIEFGSMLHMSNDSHLFHEEKLADALPLYEGKLIHHYDHRYNTFESTGPDAKEREVQNEDKRDAQYEINPRYWIERADVISKLPRCCKQTPKWLIGFRNVCRATDERTFIISFIPFSGVGNSMPLIFLDVPVKLQCAFVANGSSLALDFVIRQKIGGVNMNIFYVKQFPFLPPTVYKDEDLDYISSRVLELSYTSNSMKPLAEALGYRGEPFCWDEERRAILKAELDAYYAKLYGLTREELAYILDPTTKYTENCVTVTFPGLKANEIKKYGEYRTQRLVLAAFDELTKQGKP